MQLITTEQKEQISDYLFVIQFNKETAILLNALIPENIFDLGNNQILIRDDLSRVGRLGDYVISRLRNGDKELSYWIARKEDFEKIMK